MPYIKVSERLLIVLTLAGSTTLSLGAGVDVSVVDAKEQPVEDAVAVAVPVKGITEGSGGARTAIIDQIDKEFVPFVSVVRTKTLISFPNKDNIRHHVYSFSPAKKFELPLYKGTPSQPVLFDHAGLVVLGCNIHDWMLGYVYVVDSPWFAKTDKTGTAHIADVPPGDYDVAVYQPRAKDPAVPSVQRATVSDAQPARLSFALKLKKPVPRPHVPKAGVEYE